MESLNLHGDKESLHTIYWDHFKLFISLVSYILYFNYVKISANIRFQHLLKEKSIQNKYINYYHLNYLEILQMSRSE